MLQNAALRARVPKDLAGTDFLFHVRLKNGMVAKTGAQRIEEGADTIGFYGEITIDPDLVAETELAGTSPLGARCAFPVMNLGA